MTHAYNDYYLPYAQEKLGEIFELACFVENMDIDEFSKAFCKSSISKAFEEGDPIYIAGKSSSELFSLITNKPLKEYNQAMDRTAPYWVGWVLAYTQWLISKPFEKILSNYPCSKLLDDYHLFHEMDISKIAEKISNSFPYKSSLKEWREKRGLSQSELAAICNIPLRTIKAYEQGSVDIAKAQVETIYTLSKALNCSIEDLL